MIRDSFCAAHRLIFYDGKCENLHGHNYKVEIFIQKEKLNNIGLAMDFYDLKILLKDILKELDHKDLNEIDFFHETNPSAENIALYIFKAYSMKLEKHDNIFLNRVNVWESDNSMASYFES